MLYQVWMILVCFSLLSLTQPLNAQNLKLPQPRFENDLSHQYHIRLLEMALEKSVADDKPISFEYEFEMSEGRATLELVKGSLIDVYWLGVNQARASKLRAIPIPTTRGLIGFRKFIIRKNSETVFAQVRDLASLKQYVACQGTTWPDVAILTSAGLKVTTTPVLENLYRMLDAGRCDYFPRGLHDLDKELKTRNHLYPALKGYDNILLHYPFAVYFFTNRNNEALATRIERGLKALVEDGRLLKHMQTSPLTQDIFPLPNQNQAAFLSIPNPTLVIDERYSDSRYWFSPEDFGITVDK